MLFMMDVLDEKLFNPINVLQINGGRQKTKIVKKWFPLKNGNLMVKLSDHDGVDDSGYSNKIISQPCN